MVLVNDVNNWHFHQEWEEDKNLITPQAAMFTKKHKIPINRQKTFYWFFSSLWPIHSHCLWSYCALLVYITDCIIFICLCCCFADCTSLWWTSSLAWLLFNFVTVFFKSHLFFFAFRKADSYRLFHPLSFFLVNFLYSDAKYIFFQITNNPYTM